jgi:4-amino-4-deoxy-L-arabinose transferase-like glycosyltransferase
LFLALALVGLVLFFYRLGVPGLMDPDEGRYAEIAREIFVLGDWLIPHLNRLPYLEKPPLVYWLTALSFKVCGYTEAAARLPSAASALGGVFLAYGLGRAFWGPGPAFFGATVLATCGGYVALGRVLTLDMTLTLLLNLGVALGYLALSRNRPHLWTWAYLALALAVLTKGPVAVVLAWLIWGIWALVHRKPLKALVQVRGWLLLAVVALPWFVWVTLQYPDFFKFFVLEQHLGRYLTAAVHPQPLYYYLPLLLGFLLPWTFLMPWALWPAGQGRDPDRLFLIIWAATVLVFFSLSQGKLPTYILPALLPLALLLGARLFAYPQAQAELWAHPGLKASLLAWGLAAWGLVLLYLWPPGFLARHLSREQIFLPILPLVLAGLAFTPSLALTFRRVGLLFVGALMLSTLTPVGLEKLSLRRSPAELGRIVQARWQPDAALVGVQLYSQGLSFYSGHVFHLLAFRTELDFGRSLNPGNGLFFSTAADLRAFVQSRPLVFFFLKAQDLSGLQAQLPGELHILGRYKDCLLASYKGK